MASILDMCASSDSEDDVDYVPSKTDGAVSDSSCDEEISDDENFSGELKTTKKDEKQEEDVKDTKSDSVGAKVDDKKRANELWESFLNDVESVPPSKKNNSLDSCNGNTSGIPSGNTKAPEIENTKPVSKIFEFAGETVTVVEDVNSCDSTAEKINTQPVLAKEMPSKKRGIDSVLGKILNKNKKLTVLDKTKLDWDSFKKDEGLENDLKTFNKGKMGFIERKKFLERSDLRSFEMEKSMRQTLRKK